MMTMMPLFKLRRASISARRSFEPPVGYETCQAKDLRLCILNEWKSRLGNDVDTDNDLI